MKLRRLGLGSLLVAGVISLMMLKQLIGLLFTVCVVMSPGMLAVLLNALPIGGD